MRLSLNTDIFDGIVCPGSQKCCATIEIGQIIVHIQMVSVASDMKHCFPSGSIYLNKGVRLTNN